MKIFKKSALKKKDQNAYLDMLQEIGIMSRLNHPNIIKLYETIEEE